ncbi:hypothetical protein HMY34_09330 [Thiothrix subterranea]|uniref:hypothetical protein n=1 Tax=Thiothrix subterranea TaxID=2735563 RepID=UPI00192BAEB8|nr:hypothetical protein [Thiothrix subterranea]QQZ28940.1 hypothetical protein HMY34_09330 [Thiothrix subterranea]
MQKTVFSSLPPAAADRVAEVLAQYATTQATTHDFIYQTLTASQAYASDEEVKATLADICDTIDAIDAAYQDIQAYKQKGLSLDIWLRDGLQAAVGHLPQAEQDQVADAVRTAMNANNHALLNTLSDGAAGTNQATDVVAKGFADLNKNVFGLELREDIKVNALLNAMALETIQVHGDKENTAAAAYFASGLGDATDSNFKKVVVTAVEIAKKKQLLPDALSNVSTVEMAAIVDKGLTGVKVAHKLATGELDPIAAVEYLIDRTAARVKAVVDTTCRTVGNKVGATIGGMIGSIFGPVGTALGTAVGGYVGEQAGQKVADFVNKGVEKVASAAKAVVRSAGKTVSSAASSVWSGVKSLFS